MHNEHLNYVILASWSIGRQQENCSWRLVRRQSVLGKRGKQTSHLLNLELQRKPCGSKVLILGTGAVIAFGEVCKREVTNWPQKLIGPV